MERGYHRAQPLLSGNDNTLGNFKNFSEPLDKGQLKEREIKVVLMLANFLNLPTDDGVVWSRAVVVRTHVTGLASAASVVASRAGM